MSKALEAIDVVEDLPELLELTILQRNWVLNVASGMSQTKAAEEAGYSPNGAASQGSHLSRIPKVKAALDAVWSTMAMSQMERIARLGEMGRGTLPSKRVESDKGEVLEYDSLGALKVLHGGDVQVNIQNNVLLEGW